MRILEEGSSDLMTISFPQTEAWDGDRFVVSFPAEVDSHRVRCAISLEALQDHFGTKNLKPLDAFRANRRAIEALAERFIKRQRFEKDGSMLIRTRDC